MIANKSACFSDMLDAVRVRSQKTRENRVRGDGIIAEQNGVKLFCHAIKRSIAFHSDDPIGDHEVRTNRGANVENTFMDSGPMQDILGPAIAAARNNPKHVFHAEGDAGPVVCFHFRHGHYEI